jgi:hypothetical protein
MQRGGHSEVEEVWRKTKENLKYLKSAQEIITQAGIVLI